MDCIQRIKSTPLNILRDPKKLAKMIAEFGLNENMKEFLSPSLYKYCSKEGLSTTQLPNQFAEYLVEMSMRSITSYLEIGVRFGGAFIITVEYLKRFNANFHTAVCLDIKPPQPNLIKYGEYQDFIFMHINSQKPEAREWMKHREFDLILIDGDHSYEGCKSDYELVRGKGKIIALHDMVMIDGVIRVWEEVRMNYMFASTFVQQYEDAVITRIDFQDYKKHLGIGILSGDKNAGSS